MSGEHAKKEMETNDKPTTNHGKATSEESRNKGKGKEKKASSHKSHRSRCRCFGSDRTLRVAPQGVFRSRTVSPTVAKWFVPDARGTVDNVYRFGPLRDA
jgi:hypothetical protein